MNYSHMLAVAALTMLSWIVTTPASEKIDAKAYPYQTCLVSGEKLGTSGKDVVLIHEGQELKFCCRNCLKKFRAAPRKYMEKFASMPSANATEQSPPPQPTDDHSGHKH